MNTLHNIDEKLMQIFGHLYIVFKSAMILAFYFIFDKIYMLILQLAPDKSRFHEIMMDIKDVVSLLFSITVLVIGFFKMKKYIKDYKKNG